MDLVVPDDGSFTCDSLARTFLPSVDPTVWQIDLSSTEHIDAAGLVTLASVADTARQLGVSVRFSPPENPAAVATLSRLGVANLIRELGIRHDLARQRAAPGQEDLRLLRYFATEPGVEKTTQRVLDHLLEYDGGTHLVYGPMFELAVNAVDHSGRDGGYIAAEVLGSGAVSFAIADAGIGIRRRLIENGHNVRTDVEAIGMAARRHVSSATGRGRGRGISGVVELAGQHGGRVVLVSGSAQAIFVQGHWDPQRVVNLRTPFEGTLAQVQLVC